MERESIAEMFKSSIEALFDQSRPMTIKAKIQLNFMQNIMHLLEEIPYQTISRSEDVHYVQYFITILM